MANFAILENPNSSLWFQLQDRKQQLTAKEITLEGMRQAIEESLGFPGGINGPEPCVQET